MSPLSLEPRSNFTKAEYEAVVRRCQEFIKAGDIFQVVPSQRFAVETQADPFDIYRVLRVVNPSPFLFYLPYESFSLIGCSPEILVRVEDGLVTIRPLAGTRRRGADAAEDEALADELLADPKERAEHIMLVDLGRNDVGRVADYQTVRAHRRDEGRAVFARDAHHLERDRKAAAGADGLRRAAGRLARRHGLRRAQGPRDADHRQGRAAEARAVRRGGRLHRLHRQHGYVHRAADPGPARARRPTSRPAAGSFTTATRPPSTRRRSARREDCSRRSRSPRHSSTARGIRQVAPCYMTAP